MATTTAGLSIALLAATACERAPLPTLYDVPTFQLTDQSGAPVTQEVFRGQVTLVNFVFTTCPSICPMLTSKFVNLQRRAARESLPVRFASFSVDPANDTPERLRAYALGHRADVRTWTFITGAPAEIERVVVQGFKQAMVETPATSAAPRDITHGRHFALVDRRARVRGYYRPDPDDETRLWVDVERLLAEEEPR